MQASSAASTEPAAKHFFWSCLDATPLAVTVGFAFIAAVPQNDCQMTYLRRELLYLHLLKHSVWTTSRLMFGLSIALGDKECEVIANAVESFLATYHGLLTVREP